MDMEWTTTCLPEIRRSHGQNQIETIHESDIRVLPLSCSWAFFHPFTPMFSMFFFLFPFLS